MLAQTRLKFFREDLIKKMRNVDIFKSINPIGELERVFDWGTAEEFCLKNSISREDLEFFIRNCAEEAYLSSIWARH